MKNHSIPYENVEITDGFWAKRQELNAHTTLYAVKDRFEETGRFDAFRFDWREGMPNMPGRLWVGDVEKWIESVAYILRKEKNPALEEIVDRIAEQIERQQGQTGYYHIPISLYSPSKRWTKRIDHELYTAGHLMEAAVAYYETTGKDRLLRCACRFADAIEQVFVKEQSAAFVTPGHEEIELALVKLYRCTGEKRYLELSRFFVDQRGNNEKDLECYKDRPVNARYDQSHAPVREQDTAEGHAVRAVYLYCGMADLAYEYGDESLFAACRRLFHNIAEKRMYITGGIGCCARDEGFTIDYDLPNLAAYSETCAGIGLIRFATRMLNLDADSLYSDVAERVLYNAFLSSTSLDGAAFYYENPMEIDPRLVGREVFAKDPTHMPPPTRQKIFFTSCCPPNITRTVASLGGLLYSYSEDGLVLYVHHYMANRAKLEIGGKTMTVVLKTDYPLDGTISISVKNPMTERIAVRIPGWCSNWSIELDGTTLTASPERGYVYLPCPRESQTLTLKFQMVPQWIEANPAVQDDSGRIALQCGPMIYCLEGVDNGEKLRDLRVDAQSPIEKSFDSELKIPVLLVSGSRRNPKEFKSLYAPATFERQPQILRFIPYYAIANRGETEMIVWVDE